MPVGADAWLDLGSWPESHCTMYCVKVRSNVI